MKDNLSCYTKLTTHFVIKLNIYSEIVETISSKIRREC